MNEPVKLQRNLSLPLITLYGIGTMLGAGIYVLVGKVAGLSGMHAPMAFMLSAVIASFTAFTYAELSSRYPLSAGEAVYSQAAFHRRRLSGLVGWLVVLTGMVSAATLTRGFTGYLEFFVDLPGWLAMLLLVVLLGLVAAWGIRQSAWVIAAITLLEVAGLLLVIYAGKGSLGDLPARLPEFVPDASIATWTGIGLGAFLAFYAFIGFEDMVNVAEEVEKPRLNLPLAIVLALAVCTILYVLVALTAVLSVPIADLADSKAPLAEIVARNSRIPPYVIAFISLISITNGALVQIIMASRVLYGMGKSHLAPGSLSHVNRHTHTPLLGTLLISMTVLALALWLPLVALARITSLVVLVIYMLMNLSLCQIKLSGPTPANCVSYPFFVPVAGFVLSFGIVVFQLFKW